MILVCDDEPGLRKLVRLATFMPRRRTASKAALTLARDVEPDLVVLDLMLPIVSGIDVLEELRGGERMAGGPVIVITCLQPRRGKRLDGRHRSLLLQAF